MAATRDNPRLQKLYTERIAPDAAKKYGLANAHQIPKLSKIVVNCGIGRFLENQKLKSEIHDSVRDTIQATTGQRPVVVKAKKSVANFNVRAGAPSAFMVTIRRDRMWHFLDRLINLAIPRIRDFRGLKNTAFDAAGNYSLGLTEQAVWPEINMANVSFTHGMHINVVFEGSNPAMSRFALKELGTPFTRPDQQ